MGWWCGDCAACSPAPPPSRDPPTPPHPPLMCSKYKYELDKADKDAKKKQREST